MGSCISSDKSKQSALVTPLVDSNKQQPYDNSIHSQDNIINNSKDNNNIIICSNESKVNVTTTAATEATIVSSSGLIYSDAVDNSSNLFSAIKHGNMKLVHDLIDHYNDNNHQGNYNNQITATTTTITNNNNNSNRNSCVDENNSSVNRLLGMWNSTPLIVAAQYGQQDIARLLLSQIDVGDINHTNDKGASVLLYACMEGLSEVVRVLLDLQANITEEPTKEPIYNAAHDCTMLCTPLSVAVCNGHQVILQLLLDRMKCLKEKHFELEQSLLRKKLLDHFRKSDQKGKSGRPS